MSIIVKLNITRAYLTMDIRSAWTSGTFAMVSAGTALVKTARVNALTNTTTAFHILATNKVLISETNAQPIAIQPACQRTLSA